MDKCAERIRTLAVDEAHTVSVVSFVSYYLRT